MVAVQRASDSMTNGSASAAASAPSAQTGAHSSEKAKDVRRNNITAAKAVADAVRTSLGPRGMDKMVQDASGGVLITNDGATILEQMHVEHPAAKMLVQLSRSQDVVAGDGTTSVVVICGALLTAALDLLASGIHPSAVSDAFQVALVKSLDIVKEMAVPVNLDDRQALVQAATTSLNSKVVWQYANLLAPIAVDAVLTVKGAAKAATENGVKRVSADFVDLKNIRTVKKIGGTIDDTEMVDGLILTQDVAKGGSNAVTRVQNAKVALIQFCLSPPKTDVENSVVVQDYNAIDRIMREERSYILSLCKKIKAAGCNVLLIQKSILRDATTDLSLHFLAKMKIMAVQDIERDEVEFISKSLGLTPIAGIETFTADKLAKVDLVEEVSLGTEKMVKMTGVTKAAKETVSILVRGSNNLVLDEAERSLHDALCVVRSIVHQQYLIPGGGAPETEVSVLLSRAAKASSGMEAYCIEAYAEALNVIPFTLAENAGLPPVEIVTELRRRHAAGESGAGINVRKGAVTNISDENVVMPLLVFSSALSLATECVRQLLKIDDIVMVR
eukprot:GFKZ01007963.1.p1 GENE.GFKZ01007963.1~~GFKZ01007963.1.p1  ORF type:complete len:559 (-),score=111.40 GFKZ01007963.1:1848-3524(-)